MMEPKVSYVVVGIFVIVLGLALAAVALWMTFGWSPASYVYYQAFFEESVAGLAEDAAVKYNGVDVGHVEEIALSAENPEQVRLLLAVERGTPINEDTVAVVQTQGLTGLSYIDMDGGSPGSVLLVPAREPPYPTIRTRRSLLARIQQSAAALLDRLDRAGGGLEDLLTHDNRESLTAILDNVESITQTLAARRPEIDRTVVAAANTMSRLSRVSRSIDRDLPGLFTELQGAARSTGSAAGEFARAGIAVAELVDVNAPYVEEFARQGLGQIAPLVTEMRQLAETLQRVAHRLEENPNALVAGGRRQKGPGE